MRQSPHTHSHIEALTSPTLDRIETFLKNNSDPIFDRFAKTHPELQQKRISPYYSKEDQQKDRERLIKRYLSFVMSVVMPQAREKTPREERQKQFLDKAKAGVIEKYTAKDLAEAVARALRSQHEAHGQVFDADTELERIIADQRDAIQEWMQVLTRYDHFKPAFQYLMWRAITKRDANDVAPLPLCNEGALGALEQLLEASGDGGRHKMEEIINSDALFAQKRDDRVWRDRFFKLIENRKSTESLRDAYVLITELFKSPDGLGTGTWLRFSLDGVTDESGSKISGDGAKMLAQYSELTPWCLRYEATARSYLSRGDLLVFMEDMRDGSQPRPGTGIALDKDDNGYERRGADDSQELALRLIPAFQSRLAKGDIRNAHEIEQQLSGMERLAAADRFLSNPRNQTVTDQNRENFKVHLRVIYELDGKSIGFGNRRATTAEKLRRGRNTDYDAAIIFGSIAKTPDQIKTSNAYIGWKDGQLELSPEVFDAYDALPDDKKKSFVLFTRFPDGRADLIREPVALGAKSFTDYWHWISTYQYVTDYARSLVDPANKRNKGAFKKSANANRRRSKKEGKEREAKLVEVTVGSLFPDLFNADGSLKQDKQCPTLKPYEKGRESIEARAKKLGLAFCDPEVALEYVQKFPDRIQESSTFFAMDPISDSDGRPLVFYVLRDEGPPLLSGRWVLPGGEWRASDRLVLLRKS